MNEFGIKQRKKNEEKIYRNRIHKRALRFVDEVKFMIQRERERESYTK